MLKRHIHLFVPDGDFTASDIDEVIRSMCNDWTLGHLLLF